MALVTGTQWEVRDTGNNNNGCGFYNRNPGTSVDYTQQDAAQLSLSDLATDATGVALSSVTGGFTAAMVGNIINILSGTGFTPGHYEITARTDTNNVTIDRSAGVNASAGVGNVGGGRATLVTAFLDNLPASSVVWIKSGTYVGAVTLSNAGSNQYVYSWTGYKDTHGDTPTANDRPLLSDASDCFDLPAYYKCDNLRFEGGDSSCLVSAGSTSRFRNCKFHSTYNNSNARAFMGGQNSYLTDCEFISDFGSGVMVALYSTLDKCYIHDCAVSGIVLSGGSASVVLCIETIVANCPTHGLNLGGSLGCHVINCVMYNCGVGIYATTAYNSCFMNNLIEACTTGAEWNSGELPTNGWDYNNWHGNTADVINVTKGSHATAYDPKFTLPASGNFSLQLDSDCLDAGFKMRLGV